MNHGTPEFFFGLQVFHLHGVLKFIFKTIKVKIGEKFDLFESVPAKNFTLHTKQWVFARSRTNSEGSDQSTLPLLKVPLKTIAPVGSLDAKHWYFGDLSRADCNATLSLVFKYHQNQRTTDGPLRTFSNGPLVQTSTILLENCKNYLKSKVLSKRHFHYQKKWAVQGKIFVISNQ